MKMTILITLSLAISWILCYGAMRTAERIAAGQINRMAIAEVQD